MVIHLLSNGCIDALCDACRYAEKRMGWVITHVWHLAGQDIEKTCGEITQMVHSSINTILIVCLLIIDCARCRTSIFWPHQCMK